MSGERLWDALWLDPTLKGALSMVYSGLSEGRKILKLILCKFSVGLSWVSEWEGESVCEPTWLTLPLSDSLHHKCDKCLLAKLLCCKKQHSWHLPFSNFYDLINFTSFIYFNNGICIQHSRVDFVYLFAATIQFSNSSCCMLQLFRVFASKTLQLVINVKK